jgi:hypothetical protein
MSREIALSGTVRLQSVRLPALPLDEPLNVYEAHLAGIEPANRASISPPDVAADNGIRLIPVLVDHTLADGVAYEVANKVGEYPEYITNATFRAQFLNHAIAPFLEEFGNHDSIYAWDIMNEPRLATVVSQPDIRPFVEEVAALIRTVAPSARVTVGHYDRYYLDDYGNAATDATQIHYYSNMSGCWDYAGRRDQRPPDVLWRGRARGCGIQTQHGLDQRIYRGPVLEPER